MNDTLPEIAKIFYGLMKKRSNEERLIMGCSMFDTAKEIVKSSIYMRNSKMSHLEIRKVFFKRFYGAEFSEAKKIKIMNAFSPNA